VKVKTGFGVFLNEFQKKRPKVTCLPNVDCKDELYNSTGKDVYIYDGFLSSSLYIYMIVFVLTMFIFFNMGWE
jgi:hypothetical protein